MLLGSLYDFTTFTADQHLSDAGFFVCPINSGGLLSFTFTISWFGTSWSFTQLSHFGLICK